MKKTQSKGTIQELCEQATERVYARYWDFKPDRQWWHGQNQTQTIQWRKDPQACHALFFFGLLDRLFPRASLQHLPDKWPVAPAVRLSVPLLPDKASELARRAGAEKFSKKVLVSQSDL